MQCGFDDSFLFRYPDLVLGGKLKVLLMISCDFFSGFAGEVSSKTDQLCNNKQCLLMAHCIISRFDHLRLLSNIKNIDKINFTSCFYPIFALL